jgi:hypothetical protein
MAAPGGWPLVCRAEIQVVHQPDEALVCHHAFPPTRTPTATANAASCCIDVVAVFVVFVPLPWHHPRRPLFCPVLVVHVTAPRSPPADHPGLVPSQRCQWGPSVVVRMALL